MLRWGTRAAALSRTPFSAVRSILRFAPGGSFDEAEPHNRVASVGTLRWCSDHPGMPFGFRQELAFRFAGIPNLPSKFREYAITAMHTANAYAVWQRGIRQDHVSGEPAAAVAVGVRFQS